MNHRLCRCSRLQKAEDSGLTDGTKEGLILWKRLRNLRILWIQNWVFQMKQKRVDWLMRGRTLAAAVLAFSAGGNFALAGRLQPEGFMSAPGGVASGTSQRADTPSMALIPGSSVLQVAVSPDGKRLAWIESIRGGTEIRVAPLSDLSKSLRVTASRNRRIVCEEYGLAWAPHRNKLAFFSDCAQPRKQADLYLSHVDGKPAQRLTTLKGHAGDPGFSPDGSQIAFLFVEAVEGGMPVSGETKAGNGAIQRIAMVRAHQRKGHAPAPVTLASPADMDVYEFDWSPDRLSMAYVASEGLDPASPCENRLFVESLAQADLASSSPVKPSSAPRAILNPEAVAPSLRLCRIAGPRWSPDGRQIAFVGAGGGESAARSAWTVDAEGGTPRNLSQGRPTAAGWVEWESQEHLFVSELAGGNSQLLRYRVPEEGPNSSSAVSFGAPIFSIPGNVDDGRMCFNLSATENHTLFVFRARSSGGLQAIYGAKPGVVMSAGLEGVLQLSYSNEAPNSARSSPILTLWSSEKYRAEEWRCRPPVAVRRRVTH